MNIDNQHNYWDSVAKQKTFTHPIDINWISQYIDRNALVVDYGCGYGRIVQQLRDVGFTSVNGYDTSVQLINRGKRDFLPIHQIHTPADLPLDDNSVDCVLLIAVLTCIPSNTGQSELISLLYDKLKPGGILYISDYYLQNNPVSKSRYTYLNNDKANFGVFSLPEGVVLRHHTKEWLGTLLKNFHLEKENIIEVKTMNNNTAQVFQQIVRK